MITLLLVGTTHAIKTFCRLLAHLFLRFDHPLFKVRFTAVDTVETAGNLSRQFDMRHLILSHRHLSGTVDQNIG